MLAIVYKAHSPTFNGAMELTVLPGKLKVVWTGKTITIEWLSRTGDVRVESAPNILCLNRDHDPRTTRMTDGVYEKYRATVTAYERLATARRRSDRWRCTSGTHNGQCI